MWKMIMWNWKMIVVLSLRDMPEFNSPVYWSPVTGRRLTWPDEQHVKNRVLIRAADNAKVFRNGQAAPSCPRSPQLARGYVLKSWAWMILLKL